MFTTSSGNWIANTFHTVKEVPFRSFCNNWNAQILWRDNPLTWSENTYDEVIALLSLITYMQKSEQIALSHFNLCKTAQGCARSHKRRMFHVSLTVAFFCPEDEHNSPLVSVRQKFWTCILRTRKTSDLIEPTSQKFQTARLFTVTNSIYQMTGKETSGQFNNHFTDFFKPLCRVLVEKNVNFELKRQLAAHLCTCPKLTAITSGTWEIAFPIWNRHTQAVGTHKTATKAPIDRWRKYKSSHRLKERIPHNHEMRYSCAGLCDWPSFTFQCRNGREVIHFWFLSMLISWSPRTTVRLYCQSTPRCSCWTRRCASWGRSQGNQKWIHPRGLDLAV